MSENAPHNQENVTNADLKPFDKNDSERIAELNARFEGGNNLEATQKSFSVLKAKISSVLENTISDKRQEHQKATEGSIDGGGPDMFDQAFTKALSSKEGIEGILTGAGIDVSELVIEVSLNSVAGSLDEGDDIEGDPVSEERSTIRISNKERNVLFADSYLITQDFQ